MTISIIITIITGTSQIRNG